MILSRPKSLQEVAGRTADGASFRHELADFLDEFYEHPNAEALREEPPLLAGSHPRGLHRDTYLAAAAEHLARRFQLPLAPWVFDPRRRLPEPHFAFQTPEGRIFLLADSPAAFKSRNLFVTGNALDRV